MRPTSLAVLSLLAMLALSASYRRPVDRVYHSGTGSEAGGDLATLSSRSNLVFIGKVTRVDYRLARRTDEGRALPHAIVTYEIQRVLRGDSPGKSFTMRFIGGSDGSGRFMEVNGVPQFQSGDEDLLFVTGNGDGDCALVMCEWGRYRVLRGGVYNNHGFPVRAIRQTHAIARGDPPRELLTLRYPAPQFDELIKNADVQALMRRQNMSIAEMRKRYDAEAPKQIEVSRVVIPEPQNDASKGGEGAERYAIATTPNPLPDGPMAIEEFVSTLQRIIAQAARKPTQIRSIDPTAPITVARAVVQSPRKTGAERAPAYTRTSADATEMEALRRSDFNPVIRR